LLNRKNTYRQQDQNSQCFCPFYDYTARSDLLLKELTPDDPHREIIAEISKVGLRAATAMIEADYIVEELLDHNGDALELVHIGNRVAHVNLEGIGSLF